MDVKTVDQTSLSYRKFVSYTLITAVLTGLVIAPVLISETYGRVLNTVMLVALLGLVGRTAVSTVLAFVRVSPPEIPADVADEELPTVSVIIPAYNEAPVLEDTIEACAALDYPKERLEVVLCYEAGSVDGTCEISRELGERYDYVKPVERDEPGGGKAKATNYALEHATGEIVAGVDADHEFEPEAVRRAVRWFIDDEDTWCVKGRCYSRNPTDSVIALHATVERHIAEKADIFAREVLGGFTFFGGGQAFFRAELFEELGTFDEEVLVEDIDMSSKIHAAGKTIHVDPEVMTFEENPATLSAWWNQRKRWARGWMQVTNRYLTRVPSMSALSPRQQVDGIYTLVYAIVPAVIVITFPLGLLESLTSLDFRTFLPGPDGVLWTIPLLTPAVVFCLIALQDLRDGHRHNPAEFIAALTLGPYLIFQTAVFVTAFIEEYVTRARSVYVTTSRSEG